MQMVKPILRCSKINYITRRLMNIDNIIMHFEHTFHIQIVNQ